MRSEHYQLVWWLGFVALTHKPRVQLPDWENNCGKAVFITSKTISCNRTSGSESSNEKWTLTVGLAVFTYMGRVPLPDWETFWEKSVCWWNELGFADLNVDCRVRLQVWGKIWSLAVSVTTWKSIPMYNRTRPTRASNLRSKQCTITVGLVARICGSHPQGRCSTPKMWKIWVDQCLFLLWNRFQCNRTSDHQVDQSRGMKTEHYELV